MRDHMEELTNEVKIIIEMMMENRIKPIASYNYTFASVGFVKDKLMICKPIFTLKSFHL
jgi:hypothetical protein